MSSHLIRAQRPAAEIHLDEVHVPDYYVHQISRVREVNHVPYRCTKSYKTATTEVLNKNMLQKDNLSQFEKQLISECQKDGMSDSEIYEWMKEI